RPRPTEVCPRAENTLAVLLRSDAYREVRAAGGAALGGSGVILVEEGQGSVLGAEPDLDGTGLEIELFLGGHLRRGVAGGKDFDADFRGEFEGDLPLDLGKACLRVPTDISRPHAVDCGDGALGERDTVQEAGKGH